MIHMALDWAENRYNIGQETKEHEKCVKQETLKKSGCLLSSA